MSDHKNELGQPIGFPVPGWQPRPRPSRAPMEGRFVRLVATDPAAHAPALFEAFKADKDGRNWTYLPYGPFAAEADLRKWMDATCMGEDPLFHTVLDKATGKPVGLATYLRIEPAVGVIEVGHIHFSPLLQRTPASTETMFLMMKRVFDELGYRRYEWKCDALNEPSRKTAARLGFQYEGTFRQATMYKGRNRDTAWFAITDKDWPKLKAAYEAWLAPGNFDAEGQQRKRLEEVKL